MDRNTRDALIAAACIMLVFGVGAFFLPSIMLAIGDVYAPLAGLVAILFVAAFFLVLWLRGRSQRNKDL